MFTLNVKSRIGAIKMVRMVKLSYKNGCFFVREWMKLWLYATKWFDIAIDAQLFHTIFNEFVSNTAPRVFESYLFFVYVAGDFVLKIISSAIVFNRTIYIPILRCLKQHWYTCFIFYCSHLIPSIHPPSHPTKAISNKTKEETLLWMVYQWMKWP